MDSRTIIRLIKKLDATDLSGEKVMIDFESGKYFLLKGVANDIWEYLQEEITYGRIIANLLENYDIDEESCSSSVEKFLNQLLVYKFIEIQS